MELNRQQIIKALECCGRIGEYPHNCGGCPMPKTLDNRGRFYCRAFLAQDALALIRELTEENERLSRTRYMVYPDGRTEMIPTVESVRDDTVRKMQNRLKAKFYIQGNPEYFTVCEELIDRVAKEMLEEE